MSIKYVIFDVGMVCYPYTLNPLNDYLAELTSDSDGFARKSGIKSFNYDPFMKGEVDYRKFCKDLCEYAGVTYCKELENSINEKMLEGVGEFYDETLNVMRELKNKGIRVCLLSNALPNLSHTAEELTVKENIFVSYELGLLKPDKEIYERVIERLNVEPSEVIFVDDKEKNVLAARSVGLNGIVFNRNTINKEINKIINKNDKSIEHSMVW